MAIQSYRDLIVWQKSIQLVVLIYDITSQYPKAEMFGLVSQSRRCAVSVPSNIAEGSMRGSRKDFRQFLIIAKASGAELETQIEIAKRLKFLSEEKFVSVDSLLLEIMKMLNSMIAKLL
jgi:four helix bundle protein